MTATGNVRVRWSWPTLTVSLSLLCLCAGCSEPGRRGSIGTDDVPADGGQARESPQGQGAAAAPGGRDQRLWAPAPAPDGAGAFAPGMTEWERTRRLVLVAPAGEGDVEDESDLAASVALRWDDSALLVRYEVTDSQLDPRDSGEERWNDDGVEIFVDTEPGNGATYNPNEATQLYVLQGEGQLVDARRAGWTGEARVAQRPGGYVAEARIEWPGGLVPRVGLRLGFAAAVDDDDDGGARDAQMLWPAGAEEASTRTDVFGLIELRGDGEIVPVDGTPEPAEGEGAPPPQVGQPDSPPAAPGSLPRLGSLAWRLQNTRNAFARQDIDMGATYANQGPNPGQWIATMHDRREGVVRHVKFIRACGMTQAQIAQNAHNVYNGMSAKQVVQAGIEQLKAIDPQAYVVPFHEWNGSWSTAWASYAGSDPATFRAAARNIYTWTKEVAPQMRLSWSFTLTWLPRQNGGGHYNPNAPTNLLDYWPGSPDPHHAPDDQDWIIDFHVYDEGLTGDNHSRWNLMLTMPWGFNEIAAFARTRGRRIGSSEWGLTSYKPGGGPIGGDNPYFAQQLTNWMRNVGAEFAVYFDVDWTDGHHSLGPATPNAIAVLKQLWAR